jgi:hypothetical protein
MNSVTSLFTSRKTIRVILGTIAILGSLWLTWPSLVTPETKVAAFVGAVASIGWLFGVDIKGIATEDAAVKSGPASQVNVQSDVKNPAPVVAAVAPAPEPKPEPTEKQLLVAIYRHLQAQAKPPTAPAPTPPPTDPA